MVQPTDLADWDNLSELGWLDRPPVRCILGEGEMGAGVVIVGKVTSQNVTQVALAEDEDVVETVAADRPDKAFGERILPPRTSSGREDLLDPHALHTLPERIAVHRIAIAEKIGGCGVVGEGVHDLLSSPRRGGMLGEVEGQDPAPMVSEHDEDEKHPQLSGGDGEEVDRDQILDMVAEKRAPGLGGTQRALRDQAGDRTLGHVDTELQEFGAHPIADWRRPSCGRGQRSRR